MKNLEELIQKIELLEKKGINENEIKMLLNLEHSIVEIKAEFNKNKEFFSVSEALEQLKPYLGELKDGHAYKLKILRLIKSGEIEAENKQSLRVGYRIHKDEISRFIKEHKMTKEDWRKEAKVAQKEIAELKKRLEMFEETEKNSEG